MLTTCGAYDGAGLGAYEGAGLGAYDGAGLYAGFGVVTNGVTGGP